jgi:hypothetical protein
MLNLIGEEELDSGEHTRYCRLNRRITVLVSTRNSPGPGWAKRPVRKVWPFEINVRKGKLSPGGTQRR